MIVIGCGGRYYYPEHDVNDEMLDALELAGCTALVHGAQRGGDISWASCARNLPILITGVEVPRALYDAKGKGAFTRRNTVVLEHALMLSRLAGWGGVVECWALPGGSGTQNMITQATKAGLKVRRFPKADPL